MKILLSYGTRPEYIKISPVIEKIKGEIEYRVLFTGQHEDLCKFPHDFKVPIQNGSHRLDSIVASQLNLPDEVFDGVTHTLVQGDTASAFSLALASFHRRIKVIHLEAGLRTWDKDNPYPEEVYRQCISRIADIHLCATQENQQVLKDEGALGKTVVVGNTVLDNLTDITTSYNNDVIITLHRRENHHMMDRWFKCISQLALENPDLQFILPIHPNPNVKKHRALLKGVNVISPLQHSEFLDMLANCRVVISDSGGLQEECSFLKKKVIVCRSVTERTESIGTSSFLCPQPEMLKDIFNSVRDDFIVGSNCPYGDGRAADHIVKYLKEL